MTAESHSQLDTKSLFSVAGKTVVVTGAGAGMGRAMALGFANAGSSVVVVDLDQERATRVAEQATAEGGRAISVPADVRDEEQVAAAVQAGVDAFGEIGVLVNNAGIAAITGIKDIQTLPLSELDRMLSINLKGTVITSQAVLPGMLARKAGAIINMGSSWSSRGSVFNQKGGSTDYCATKGAVQTLTRSMAQDLAPHGIRVNAMAPGLVADTEIYTRQLDAGDIPTAENDRGGSQYDLFAPFLQFVPLGRMQYANDMVGTAIYLASDASGYVTGQTIHVNGGMIMAD